MHTCKEDESKLGRMKKEKKKKKNRLIVKRCVKLLMQKGQKLEDFRLEKKMLAVNSAPIDNRRSMACWLSNLLCRSNSGSSTIHARAAAVFAISGRTACSPPSLSPSQTLYKRYKDDRGALRETTRDRIDIQYKYSSLLFFLRTTHYFSQRLSELLRCSLTWHTCLARIVTRIVTRNVYAKPVAFQYEIWRWYRRTHYWRVCGTRRRVDALLWLYYCYWLLLVYTERFKRLARQQI